MKGELQYRGGRNNNTLGIFARSWFPGTYIYIMGSVRKKNNETETQTNQKLLRIGKEEILTYQMACVRYIRYG